MPYLLSHGCPPKKIVLGISVFGRSFLGAGGPGHHFREVGGDTGVFEYKRLPRRGTKEVVDRCVGAASYAGADGGFVSYDNPETVKMKAAYCKQKGLGVSGARLSLLSTSLLFFLFALSIGTFTGRGSRLSSADASLDRGSFTGTERPTRGRRRVALWRPGSALCIRREAMLLGISSRLHNGADEA